MTLATEPLMKWAIWRVHFSRFLTNLTPRQNHTLTIVPPASLADTNVSLVSPVSEISVPKNSTIRLTALANDTSGNLAGLRFFSPQSVEKGPLYSWRQDHRP